MASPPWPAEIDQESGNGCAIAELDEIHQTGIISEDDYTRHRSVLRTELKTLLSQRTRHISGWAGGPGDQMVDVHIEESSYSLSE